jgi:signal peptidase I
MNSNVKNILEWVYCIIIAFVLALLFRYFIGTPTIVRQRSMYPTLKGDIITFEAPSKSYESYEADQSNPIAIYNNEPEGIFGKFVYNVLELTKKSYIKRVIALPGDHVKIEDGSVYINGEKLEEDYLQPDVVTESTVFTDFIVPEGYLFAMGDNRTKSTDCRSFGCIPFEKVEGIVVLRFWPFSTFGKVK